jgi:hypothetical protein
VRHGLQRVGAQLREVRLRVELDVDLADDGDVVACAASPRSRARSSDARASDGGVCGRGAARLG